MWDTGRRYGEIRNPDSPRFSLPPPTQLQREELGHQRLRHSLLGAHLVPHALPIIKFATRRTSTPNTIIAGHFPMIAKLKVCNTVVRQTFANTKKQCLSLGEHKSHLVSQKKGEKPLCRTTPPDPFTSCSHGTKTRSCNRGHGNPCEGEETWERASAIGDDQTPYRRPPLPANARRHRRHRRRPRHHLLPPSRLLPST